MKILLLLLLLLLALGLGALAPRPTAEAPLRWPEWIPVLRDEVRAGDTMQGVLARLGLPDMLLPDIVAACEGLLDLRRLRPGEPVLLVRHSVGDSLRLVHYGSGARCLELTLPLALRGDSLVAVERTCRARLDSARTTPQVVVHQGRVGSHLYEAVLAAGGGPQLVLGFADIFQWDVDFLLDVREGDMFWLAVEESRVARSYLGDSVTVEGRILAARYENGGRRLEACRLDGCGEAGYFNGQGQSYQKEFLTSPLTFRRVSSHFGLRRHPVLRQVRMHHGIDYAAPHGTPVVAAAAGVVTKAGWEKGYGQVVRIRHNQRRETVYGHLSSLADGMRTGRRVAQDEFIGRVGATGLATGPHLHYEIIENGRSVDPRKVRNEPGKPVPPNCLPAFLAEFDRWFGADPPGLEAAER